MFCAPPPCSVVWNIPKLCYSYFFWEGGRGIDAGMVADAAPLGHYYLCIHLCSHWNNSRAPATAFPPPWGAASEPLRSFSYSIGRPGSKRPEQEQQKGAAGAAEGAGAASFQGWGGVQSKAHIYGRPLLILPLQINTSVRGCSLHQKGADIIGADWF